MLEVVKTDSIKHDIENIELCCTEYEKRLKNFDITDLRKFHEELEINELDHKYIKPIYQVAIDACCEFVFHHTNEEDYIDKIDEIKKQALLQASQWIADLDLAKHISKEYLEKIIQK